MAEKRFIAVTGAQHHFGDEVFRLNQTITFIKEPDNACDPEAIRAELDPIGKVGYVANSVHTVPIGCRSAGRIYDTFDDRIKGTIQFVVKGVAIVELGVVAEAKSNESV
ncbi:MAG TPA: DNA-binding protein [Bacillales bacterium]|nr:DNA-binding protein [Bacillales bacterium]